MHDGLAALGIQGNIAKGLGMTRVLLGLVAINVLCMFYKYSINVATTLQPLPRVCPGGPWHIAGLGLAFVRHGFEAFKLGLSVTG